MGIYCDTKILEQNWYHWLIASPTPQLEHYRPSGLLLTKVIPSAPCGAEKHDPFWGRASHQVRAHCLAVGDGIFFNSYHGTLAKPQKFKGSRPITCQFPDPKDLKNLEQMDPVAVAKLVRKGYVIERPIGPTWHDIAISVNSMCDGISKKFNMPTEDDRAALAQEALVQALKKISEMRLLYTPGKAPVFNLLTTTIYRIIFSVLNKDTKDKKNKAKYMQAVLPHAVRGQHRAHGRIVTRRVFGSLVASPA